MTGLALARRPGLTEIRTAALIPILGHAESCEMSWTARRRLGPFMDPQIRKSSVRNLFGNKDGSFRVYQ